VLFDISALEGNTTVKCESTVRDMETTRVRPVEVGKREVDPKN
jgi:hypothetical protein